MAPVKSYDVILDCYSDEPSGYGVPPFLGVHQRYISASLAHLGRDHFYITIDDLRNAVGRKRSLPPGNSDISVTNLTQNADVAVSLLRGAATIYIVMGCFVDYEYVSAVPPRAPELYELMKEFSARKILFYVLGAMKELPTRFMQSDLFKLMDTVVTGLAYNFVLRGELDSFSPNYDLLASITRNGAPILEQIGYARVVEIESMIGCDWAQCSFCIERVRGYPVLFREVGDIIADVEASYRFGARHFRIGRNPNFYHYMAQDVSKMEALLYGIRNRCPDLKVLHIDNVNPESVVTPQGREITKLLIHHCTSGNIAPFGIESFDPVVRERNTINATVDQIMEAISIMNEYGKEKGENGAPKLLAGINLIYNLPGQRPETQSYNLKHLSGILGAGLHTQRLFFRKHASPLGISMKQTDASNNDEQYHDWMKQIYETFSVPMLRRVFPTSTILRGARAEAWQDGNSILRQLGTTPPRIVVENHLLPIGSFHDIEVQGVQKHRTLIGKVLN